NETVILSLSVSPNSQYALASPNSATVTLTDNDLPIVSIEASDSDAAEPSDLGVFTLSRTSNLANPLTVYYTVGGTATNGTDYNNLSGTVTFAAGASTATIDVSPIDDLLLEGGETVTLTLNPSPDSQYIIGDLNNATVVLADNELEWLKQLGTSFRDKSNGIATDSNSNVYITGSTWGSLGGNNAGGYDYDAWTAKYSSSGELLWKAQLGTSTYDGSNGVATDSDGNVYLTGDTGGSLGGTNAGSYDAWVAKYSSSGQLLWKAQLGTSAYDGSNGVATDNLGNVYLTGDTCGSLGGTNPNTGTDTWVAKYSSSVELLWKAQLGTLYQDSSSGVATDSDGNVYLTGSTFWSLGGIWVAKYSSSGGLLWKAQLGNSSSVEGNGIATDSQGNVYLTGRTVVAKYNSSGELLWQAQLETANNSTSSSIATDSDGNVYLTGYTTGSLQGTNAGSYDAWFAKYSSSGELLWKAQLGTANDDFSNGIATDSQGNVYLTGDTQGSLGGINVGDQDAWVAKYLGSGSDLPTVTIDASDANAAEPNDVGVFTLTRSGDPDNPLTVNYTISGTATNETDYDKLTGTVTFAAGASTATIEIKPLDDSVFEGNETVILTLSPESGYSLGDSASATVTLADDEQPTSFAINSTGDAGDANPGDGFALTADGVTTLRAAIEEANASAGTQTIVFNIPTTDPGYNPTTGAFTIKPLSALPIISDAVVIDGTTQPGFSTKPIIELDGSSAGNSNGLIISAGDSTVRGLVVNRFAGNGIVLNTKGNNIIEGNYIGTDVTGTLDYGNNGSGIRAETSNNRIGGTQTGSRNIISGSNIGDGILIVGGGGNQIFGNYIGTDFTGAIALGNTNGVVIDNAPNTIIGGTEVGAGNVISGNNSNGVAIIFEGSTGTSILGNYIGTNASGTASLANQANGISVGSNANDIIIGGTETGAGNLISGNNLSGVSITGLTSQGNSHGNSILGNSIFGNGGLGIDLANGIFQGDGVTPNDLGDGDTGANNLQNYPLLTSAVSIGDNTDILGTFNSNPNNTFRLEFFANNALDPSGYGEGQTFLGVNDVTTDASGNAVINITLSTTVPLGQYITATATDLAGNTSEFSAGIIVLNPVNGTANSETVTGTSGDDYINAGAGNDTANGGEGNDVLDGGTGSDRLYGGEGNDTYIVDNSRDVVVESGGQGEDTVKSSVNHNLTANVEDLILTGTANISGTGNDLDNTIMGNSGNNLLKGLGGNDILLGEAGNDTLVGGSGNDILTGGDGSDQFLFGSGAAFATSAFGVDTLADFIRGSDKICLSKTSFNALSTAVNTNLQAGEFAAIDTTLANEVTLAGSSSARIVYNLSTGNLFYNQNGATDGLGNGALFATLTGTPLLDASDFLVQA
ncbi:MAG: beta strand repeat-containing protein, partial [Microcystis panniformis]